MIPKEKIENFNSVLLSELKEIEALYEKLKIDTELTLTDFERGCYEMVKNIIARIEKKDNIICDNCTDWKQGNDPDKYCLVCNRMVEL